MKKIYSGLCFIFISISLFSQTQIEPVEARQALKKGKKVQLIDVRTADEYAEKHVKNATNINWYDRENFDKEALKLNRKKPIYVYCKAGGRSAQAAKFLTEQGYTVYDITGGITKWEEADLPVIEASNHLKNLTQQQFDAVVDSAPTVLVDFYANWCVPCKELEPILTKIKKSRGNTVKIVKINVDVNRELTKGLGITGIPAMMIFKGGKLSWTHRGLTDEATIIKQL